MNAEGFIVISETNLLSQEFGPILPTGNKVSPNVEMLSTGREACPVDDEFSILKKSKTVQEMVTVLYNMRLGTDSKFDGIDWDTETKVITAFPGY